MNRDQIGKVLGVAIVLNALSFFIYTAIEKYQLFSALLGAVEREQSLTSILLAFLPAILLAFTILVVSASLGWLLIKEKQINLAVAITASVANLFNGSIGFTLTICYLIYRFVGSSANEQST